MMHWLLAVIRELSHLLPLGILALLVVVFRVSMRRVVVQLDFVSGEDVLDHKYYYSRESIIRIFRHYGATGMILYKRFMTFDILFPLLYGTFLACLIYIGVNGTHWEWLVLIPIAASAFDYIENIFFRHFVRVNPNIPRAMVSVVYPVSVLKFLAGFATVAAGLLALFLWIKRVLACGVPGSLF